MKILTFLHPCIFSSLSLAFPEHTWYRKVPSTNLKLPIGKNVVEFDFRKMINTPLTTKDFDLFVGFVEGCPHPKMCLPLLTRQWKWNLPKVWFVWYVLGESTLKILQGEPVVYTSHFSRNKSLGTIPKRKLKENALGPVVYAFKDPNIWKGYTGKKSKGLIIVREFSKRKIFGYTLYMKMKEIQENLPIKIIGEGELVPYRQILDAYRNYRVFLELTLEHRPLTCTMTEAMMSGMPIITTSFGETPRVVRNGIEGFVLDPKNPKDFVDKLNFFINNPDKAREMGKNSRQRALELFGRKRFREKMEEVFKFALGEKVTWDIK